MIAVTDAHMAMVILTGLYLLSVEQVTGRDVKPAGNCLHQLIAGDGKAIHIAAAGKWIPGMGERRDGGTYRRQDKQYYSHRRNTNPQVPAPA